MGLAWLINSLGSFVGWSPVGKSVMLHIDNANDASLSGLLISGKPANINTDGSAVIELHTMLELKNGPAKRIIAIPRHTGYGFDYLWWGSITVNFADQGWNWLAIGEVRIGKPSS